MIETKAFIETLKRDFGYTTPENPELRLKDRLFGRFNAWYYKGVMQVVLKGGRMYRANTWNRVTWQDLSLDIWRTVEACGGRIEVRGLEHLEQLDRPAVIVANHMSVLETFSIPAMVLPFQDMVFVIKESLVHTPLVRPVMLAVDHIRVKRENPRDDMKVLMEEGPKRLAAGKSIVVFPQSTRSAVLDLSRFNSVAVKMAKRVGAPVVPLALKTDFQQIGQFVKDVGPVDRSKTVYFDFGPPMEVTGNGREAHQAVLAYIAERLTSHGGEVVKQITG